MNVKVNLAGQEIEVPVTPEQEAELRKQCAAETEKQYEIQFMANFFRETSREIRQQYEFTTDETDLLVDELFHTYPHQQDVCDAIIADNYLKQVRELADGIVEERVKIYRVTVHYEGDFDVFVKARNEDEARGLVEDAPRYDIAAFVEPVEADFEVESVEEDDTASEWAVSFAATE